MSDVSNDPASGLDYITAGETKNPKHILVVLHGMGDTCHGIEFVGQAFAEKLPDTLVLIPEAPRERKGVFGPIKLNKFIDGQLEQYGLKDEALAIYGFSAGGTMALAAAGKRAQPCAGVVSHSGFALPGNETPLSTPPVLLIFGDQEVGGFPGSMMLDISKGTLETYGMSVTEHICENLAHAVNDEVINVSADYIAKALGAPAQQPAAPKSKKPKVAKSFKI